MTTLQIHTKSDAHGILHFDIPLGKPDAEADIQVIVSETESNVQKFDFTGITGRLKWKGDAVKTQQELRSEW